MIHLDRELEQLKKSTTAMWVLVQSQIEKAYKALAANDKDLAREVIANEKRVNSMELKIDSDCEDLFALYSPVASDLRTVLATLKINTNLERIGDLAEGICKHILSEEKAFDKELLKASEIQEMYDVVIEIMKDVLKAYIKEDTKLARTIFKKDEILNEINMQATKNITEYIGSDISKIEAGLNFLSIIRKLERVGDQITNIAEEIIFSHEAKVLKHL
ncbi:phosphate signaling complex protein PhoU [Albibacterium bauzanense]|uniref:Phosphate-specific transport system accessory protein PhoU n=1 Tax=Albibacterium bauzanense TaxID=653929 RepID=A0A4R1M164_9SPHI|nr:phosphate signaling complex protein PhoU [Albibacterium bauzanense]TCK85375.1 PhoU-like phosphate uptake regulator [Albibacterium bauzanense]